MTLLAQPDLPRRQHCRPTTAQRQRQRPRPSLPRRLGMLQRCRGHGFGTVAPLATFKIRPIAHS
eukprot:4295464-Pyramimonas_sp.AAC.1